MLERFHQDTFRCCDSKGEGRRDEGEEEGRGEGREKRRVEEKGRREGEREDNKTRRVRDELRRIEEG
jgi:hypothetical protein